MTVQHGPANHMQQIKDLIPGVIAKSTTTQESKLSGWIPSLDAYEPTLVEARDACAIMVADMERGAPPYWLTLAGENGCGKTYLLRQVWEQAKRINPGNPKNNPIWPPNWEDFLQAGVNIYGDSRPYALWYDEGGLASRMRAGDHDLPRNLRGDYFVALDELGATRDPTNYISEAVGTLCDNRLGRWSVFATNLQLQEIADRMDARITSRLIRDDNKVVTIKAVDYRLRKNK